jgi:hypothetical protein
MIVIVFVSKLVVHRQNIPALLRKADSAPSCAPVLSPVQCAKKKSPGDIPARADTDLRSSASKEAASWVYSEQDDKRFRFHLGRPRAAAHGWGKGAHILTEINRLPQAILVHPMKNPGGRQGFRQLLGSRVRIQVRFF